MVGDDHVEVANEKLVHVFSEFTILIALPKVQIWLRLYPTKLNS